METKCKYMSLGLLILIIIISIVLIHINRTEQLATQVEMVRINCLAQILSTELPVQ